MLVSKGMEGTSLIEQTIKTLSIVNIAVEAGKKILKIYNSEEVKVTLKEDESPITIADKQSHLYIVEQLSEQYPEIPILSEEGDSQDYQLRKDWQVNWLIDPLDGTKEFIKRNGEFTVNIGLIENHTPVFGVIYSPAQDIAYFASRQFGSYKLINCSNTLASIPNDSELLNAAQKLPLNQEKKAFNIAVSRSHFSSDTQGFIDKMKERYKHVEVIEAGSSIKMCLVAEGAADIYPRLSYSMEWDTAAGEAIVKYSGGTVAEYPTNKPLQYNKENLKNPFHLVKRAD